MEVHVFMKRLVPVSEVLKDSYVRKPVSFVYTLRFDLDFQLPYLFSFMYKNFHAREYRFTLIHPDLVKYSVI